MAIEAFDGFFNQTQSFNISLFIKQLDELRRTANKMYYLEVNDSRLKIKLFSIDKISFTCL